MTPQEALEALMAAESRPLPLTGLQTDPALQPREERMVPFRDKGRVGTRSEEHIGTLRLALEASASIELEPLLAAEIARPGDGAPAMFVVDGHHRLKAYQFAGRNTVPVRSIPMGHRLAVLASKLVNCTDRALEMHREQRLDAAWQYLAAMTRRGSSGLPEGESLRKIAGRFGVSRPTVDRMKAKLPQVNPKDYAPEAHDPGTGFPRWRYVREAGAGWQDMKQKMTPEQMTQHEAEKLARRIGALLEKATADAAKRAFEMLATEEKLAHINQDTREFLAVLQEPDEDF